ncbi:MAG: energy transducer TonB [Candidatus Margulisbacteria bacterium]|jgi:TonB family protein|nr:energy transducer TonB [Candidatus Margulisiibacteriota bacterium]
MIRYFLLSLFLHLLVLLPLNLTGRLAFNNFYFGAGQSGSAQPVMPAGLFSVEQTDAGYAIVGVEELAVYADPQNFPPRYPPLALLRRWQGETTLLLYINKNGAIDRVFLEKSSGHKILDEAALNTAAAWRFSSLNRNIQVRFPVRFVLDR